MGKKVKEPAREPRREVYSPITSLRDEVDRLFDDFAMGWPFAGTRGSGLLSRGRGGAPALGEAMPDVDVVDKPKRFEIRAELPGVDEKDIDLRIVDDAVVLRAEKREEHEEGEEGGSYYVSECRYGAFQRIIPLPPGVDTSDADATFARGVLTVRFPKAPGHHEEARRIEVRSA